MAGATMGGHAGDPECAVRAFCNGVRAPPQRLEHARYRPFRQKPQGRLGHWHQRKIAPLPHVETARASLKFGAIVDEAGEILGILARNPVMLDWATALPARSEERRVGKECRS